MDMASDRRHNALYIADSKKQVIHRIYVSSPADSAQWPVAQKPSGVSVALDSCNVLVSCSEARRLFEFSTQGSVVREFCVRDAIALYHAVTLPDGQVVASVATGGADSPDHRVCYVDTYGKTSGQCGFAVGGPAHLAAIGGGNENGNLLIGDISGGRVMMLSSALTNVRVLGAKNHGLRRAWRICVDCSTRRLYVADNAAGDSSGRVMVFSL